MTICIFLPLKAGKLYYIHDLWLGCWPVSLRYTSSKEHGSKVFHFKEITDSHCLLVHNQIFEKEEELKVPFEDLKLWRKHKGHVQALASNEMVEAKSQQGRLDIGVFRAIEVGLWPCESFL